jgi:Heat induced stress protein YflT domain
MSTQPRGLSQVRARLNLEYPMSLGTFDKYEEAQKLVDTLSDKEFPVQNCLIVGTDLKQLERITGRLTWGRVLLGGALSGVWLGLFVGLIFALFAPQGGNVIQIVLSTVLFGALFGLAWAAGTYALTGGQRDFSSVSLIVPSKYEVLVEHKFAQQARDILGSAGLGGSSYGYVPTGGYASDAPGSQPPPPPANQL